MYNAYAISCSNQLQLAYNAPAMKCSNQLQQALHSQLTSMCAFAVAVAVSAGYSLATAFCSTEHDSCRRVQLLGASHAEHTYVAAIKHVTP
jgi:Na+(H+)/acetate symporter ActP